MAREMLHQSDNMLHAPQNAAEETFRQLEKITHSQAFQGSESLISLLKYLVQETIANPEAQSKEHAIATTVFGRNSDFDPRIDSVVRVQAKRLRTKLQDYYETEGKSDTVIIDLPKGHYKATVSYVEPALIKPIDQPLESVIESATEPISSEKPDTVVTNTTSKERIYRTGLIAVTVTLIAVLVILVVSTGRQPTPSTISQTKNGLIWQPFLKDNAQTLVVLSNPPIYRFSNDADPDVLLKDSIGMPPDQMIKLGKELKNKPVMRQNRPPRLILSSEDYTGMGEAIGLFNITNLFQSAGRSVTLKQSRTISAEDLKNHNVVLLGSAWVNDWVEKLPIKEDFTYSVRATIVNNNPLPGEEREYAPVFNQQTGDLIQDYALITVRPGVSDAYRFMALSGILSEGTQAAAEYVTKKEYLDVLNQRLQKLSRTVDDQPKYYQVLLKVDVDNNIPTTVSVLSVHRLEINP